MQYFDVSDYTTPRQKLRQTIITVFFSLDKPVSKTLVEPQGKAYEMDIKADEHNCREHHQ